MLLDVFVTQYLMEISSSHSAFTHLTTTASLGPNADADPASITKDPATVGSESRALTEQRQQEQEKQEQQEQEIRNLVRRDREVRQHEQAHAAAGGPYAGSPTYEFTKGPNGVSYATGGHVSIDVSDVPGDAQATINKMQTVQRAALAPAQPSAQDRAVAAEAAAKASQARAELRSVDEESPNRSSTDSLATKTQANAYEVVQPSGEEAREAGSLVDAFA